MSETIQPNDLLKGPELQVAIRNQIQAGLENARKNDNEVKEAFITACDTHFNDLAGHIDWDTPKTRGEVKSFPGNFASATQYAQLKTGQDISQNYGLKDSEEWWKIINNVLSSGDTRDIFVSNFWRSPMVVRPRRAIPLQFILPHFFGNNPISGADLGAGLHVALPLLNSDTFSSSQFTGKTDIEPAAPVNLQLGIGIDKQPRELDWAIASEEPGLNAANNLAELKRAYQHAVSDTLRFPFISANVFDLGNHIPHGGLDFAFSSFLRHQLGTEPTIQKRFFGLIGSAVREGGIWVDIGKEFVEQTPSKKIYNDYDVDVYQVQRGEPRFIGTPFTLKGNQIDIQSVNPQFFRSARNLVSAVG